MSDKSKYSSNVRKHVDFSKLKTCEVPINFKIKLKILRELPKFKRNSSDSTFLSKKKRTMPLIITDKNSPITNGITKAKTPSVS